MAALPSTERSPAADHVALAAHVGLGALAAVSALRFAVRHGWADQTPVLIALTVAMLVADLAARRSDGRSRVAWLIVAGSLWLVLTALAPSFVWCAFPLLLLFLRHALGRWGAMAASVVALASIAALWRLATRFDPSVIAGPVVVAMLLAVTHRALSRETAAHAAVIDQLTATRQQLAEQEHASGVMSERQRLAREVHDSVAQGIASVLMLTQAAVQDLDQDPGAARRHLVKAVEQARNDLDEVRHIVHALAPRALDGASLGTALARLCEQQSAAGPTAVSFTIADDPVPTSTSEDAALLRITQEAVSNALRHAHASRVDVTLSYLPDGITLDVVDDGRGFDVAEQRCGGHGLGTMSERAAEIGGRLSIESAPGNGTAVTATLAAPPGAADGALTDA